MLRIFLLSVREWLRQYMQLDGIYFRFSEILELYAESVSPRNETENP